MTSEIEYKILTSTQGQHDLAVMVREHISDGWEPQGGYSLHDGGANHNHHSQAMVRKGSKAASELEKAIMRRRAGLMTEEVFLEGGEGDSRGIFSSGPQEGPS